MMSEADFYAEQLRLDREHRDRMDRLGRESWEQIDRDRRAAFWADAGVIVVFWAGMGVLAAAVLGGV